MNMTKSVIPALSFKNNQLVIVREGEYVRYSEERKNFDLRGAFKELKDFDRIYLLDIDGIESDKPQTELIRKATATKNIWVDIGARHAEGITDAFIAGADKAVLSTKTLLSFEEIERSIELSDELILSIDYDGKIVSPSEEIRKMGVAELTEKCVDRGIDMIIYSDLSTGAFDGSGLRKIPDLEFDLLVGGLSRKKINYIDHENIEYYILGFEEAIEFQSR